MKSRSWSRKPRPLTDYPVYERYRDHCDALITNGFDTRPRLVELASRGKKKLVAYDAGVDRFLGANFWSKDGELHPVCKELLEHTGLPVPQSRPSKPKLSFKLRDAGTSPHTEVAAPPDLPKRRIVLDGFAARLDEFMSQMDGKLKGLGISPETADGLASRVLSIALKTPADLTRARTGSRQDEATAANSGRQDAAPAESSAVKGRASPGGDQEAAVSQRHLISETPLGKLFPAFAEGAKARGMLTKAQLASRIARRLDRNPNAVGFSLTPVYKGEVFTPHGHSIAMAREAFKTADVPFPSLEQYASACSEHPELGLKAPVAAASSGRYSPGQPVAGKRADRLQAGEQPAVQTVGSEPIPQAVVPTSPATPSVLETLRREARVFCRGLVTRLVSSGVTEDRADDMVRHLLLDSASQLGEAGRTNGFDRQSPLAFTPPSPGVTGSAPTAPARQDAAANPVPPALVPSAPRTVTSRTAARLIDELVDGNVPTRTAFPEPRTNSPDDRTSPVRDPGSFTAQPRPSRRARMPAQLPGDGDIFEFLLTEPRWMAVLQNAPSRAVLNRELRTKNPEAAREFDQACGALWSFAKHNPRHEHTPAIDHALYRLAAEPVTFELVADLRDLTARIPKRPPAAAEVPASSVVPSRPADKPAAPRPDEHGPFGSVIERTTPASTRLALMQTQSQGLRRQEFGPLHASHAVSVFRFMREDSYWSARLQSGVKLKDLIQDLQRKDRAAAREFDARCTDIGMFVMTYPTHRGTPALRELTKMVATGPVGISQMELLETASEFARGGLRQPPTDPRGLPEVKRGSNSRAAHPT